MTVPLAREVAATPPWREWSLAEWNVRLFERFFCMKDSEDGPPVERLILTRDVWCSVAGDAAADGHERRDAFLRQVRADIVGGGKRLGRAVAYRAKLCYY